MRITQKKCFQAQQYHPLSCMKKSKSNSIFNMVRIGTAKANENKNDDLKNIKNNLLETQRFD